MIENLDCLEKLDLRFSYFTYDQAIKLFRKLTRSESVNTLIKVNLDYCVKLREKESSDCSGYIDSDIEFDSDGNIVCLDVEFKDCIEALVKFLADAEKLKYLKIRDNTESCEIIKEKLVAEMDTNQNMVEIFT